MNLIINLLILLIAIYITQKYTYWSVTREILKRVNESEKYDVDYSMKDQSLTAKIDLTPKK